MKVHTNLEELLEDFLDQLDKNGFLKNKISYHGIPEIYLFSNSLALGKPEPLAKNKRGENICKCGSTEFQGHLFSEAIRCKKCKTVYTNV